MEGKYLAIFALVFVVAAVVSKTEAVPFSSDAAEAVVAVAAETAPVEDEASSSKQGRQFYGLGYPGLGYGGLGYNSGSSSAAAAAAAASSSGTGLGYPYGRK